MSVWYYADAGNTRQGPITPAELVQLRLQGQLNWDSLVWREGMAEWQPMRSVAAELAQAEDTATAPASAAPPVSGEADTRPIGATVASATTAAAGGTGDAWSTASSSTAVAAANEAASPYAPPVATVSASSAVVAGGEVVLAGFWKRVAAYTLDSLLIGFASMFITVPLAMVAGLGSLGMSQDEMGMGYILGQVFINLLSIALAAVYYSWFHSSRSMATLGKQAVGIKVVRTSGERISLARAIGRYFAALLSGIILSIGYLMAAFTERKQGLHDMMCDTLVVDRWAFTDRPDLQRRELGTVTWVILIVLGVLTLVVFVGVIVLLAALGGALGR